MTTDKRPVTLLTGFLGSGKTTLLNALLKRPELAHTAVVINEFGEAGIDHLLVERGVDNVLLLDGGCICCSVTTTLADTLTELLGKEARGEVPAFVRVVVETTGLAEPEPIVRQLWVDSFMRERFALDAIVAVVSATDAAAQLERFPEARRQVAAADRIVLTKTDLADPAAAERALDGVNTTAPRIRAEAVRADPRSILGIGPVDAALASNEGSPHHHHHPHTERFTSVAFSIDGAVSWEAISAWIDELRRVCGSGLLRCKGVVRVVGESAPVVLQGVGQVFHPPGALRAPAAADLRSRIVVICEGVDPAAIPRMNEMSTD
jgi:G3E family GTPase